MEIWINLTSTKCSSALFLLDEARQDYTVRRYLDDPPSVGELQELLRRLALEPWDIVRIEEPVVSELGLASWPCSAATRGRWIEAMVRHPILIQRPIIIADDGTAVVARTRQAVCSVLPPTSPPTATSLPSLSSSSF